MRGKAGAAREPGAERSRCGSVGQVSRRMGWSSLKPECRDVPEPLKNCKIRDFTAQRSLGRISGDGGGGGGGGRGDLPPAARRDPEERNNRTKLSGKEPVIFDGDRSKAEAFLLEWTIYRLLNGEQDIMRQAFSRVMLFLTFIKGPDIQEWSNMQVGWLGSRILAGAGRNEEHLYDEVMDSFKTAFTDTMSLQK